MIVLLIIALMARDISYKELYYSGKLAELARQCGQPGELARRLNVTTDALGRAFRRLRQDDPKVPSLSDWFDGVKPGDRLGGAVELPAAAKAVELPPRLDLGDVDIDVGDLGGPVVVGGAAKPRVEQITPVEEHRLRRRVKELEAQNRELIEQLSEGGEYHEVVREVLAKQHEAPPARIDPRERESHLKEATPLVLASDWHVEEEVTPEQVAGRNRYNLEIATGRMERFFESSMWAVRHQRDIFKIRDFIGWWGGDLLTNFLHEDDVENNQLAPLDTILFLQTNLIKGIDYWLTDPEIENFIFPCNDGNHGRTTKKMRNSTRREHSLEVFLYAQLAYHYRNEPRIKFILPTSQFTFLDDIYGRTIRFLHGDVFKYAGGVGGITVPLFRAMARWEKAKHADLTCMGHWHQRYCLPDCMVNGSMIGYNSYAMGGGFPYEPPVQSLRMLEPRRWCSVDIPLWVSELADDDRNWRQKAA